MLVNTYVYFILFFTDSCVTFPEELHYYGLDEDILSSVFRQVQSGKEPIQWSLKGVPNVNFYQKLHPFLKKWSVTHEATKSMIGRFYVAIDKNLKDRGSRADNVYRFIERVVECSQSSDATMSYGLDKEIVEVKALRKKVKHCTETLDKFSKETDELRKQLEDSKKQLCSARCALRDVTNEKLVLLKRKDIAEKKAVKCQELGSFLEEEVARLQEDNVDLSIAMSELENELASFPDDRTGTCKADDVDFSIHTKCGRRYSPAIRKLYYTLLADLVPPSKIADIIKTVLKSFSPSLDVHQLKLPQRACASYMRREELKTISSAHKVAVLCEATVRNEGFRMNTDGTTKAQRKLGALAINDVVVSINEVPDGTARSAVADVSRELEKLRRTVHALNMPNAQSINWTLFVSSTSDSASTQK